MENQHRQIKGYRELSQEEIDLMNDIKAFGPQLESLVVRVRDHISRKSSELAPQDGTTDRADAFLEFHSSEPGLWVNKGKNSLQEGLMFLTRSIARPTFF